MAELPDDLNYAQPPSQALIDSWDAMRARYKATGQATPPPGSPEARENLTPEERAWWRRFWLRQAGRDLPR